MVENVVKSTRILCLRYSVHLSVFINTIWNLNAYIYWSSSRAPNRCLLNNGKSTPGIKLHHFRVNILYAMEFTRASFVRDEFKEIKACACIKLLGLGWSPSIWWSEWGRVSKSKGDPQKLRPLTLRRVKGHVLPGTSSLLYEETSLRPQQRQYWASS